jgi:penicillin G amidase
MSPWRDRALRALDAQAVAGHPQRSELRRLLLEDWNGCACVDSAAYLLSRSYLYSLYGELFGAADQNMRRLDPDASFAKANPRWPVVLASLIDQQPSSWLPKERKNWRELELAAIDDTISSLTKHSVALKDATWGQRNKARIAHPFIASLPFLSRWLAAPADPLPGDGNMPRVSAPSFGQSERMVVSPGHEERAIFNMPGGQSGHPLSAYFLAGHRAWVLGRKTSLLPGPRDHLLILTPVLSGNAESNSTPDKP